MSYLLRATVAVVLCGSGVAKLVWPSAEPSTVLEKLLALLEIILGLAWFYRPSRPFLERCIAVLLVVFAAYHGYFMLTRSGAECGCFGSRIRMRHSTMLLLSGGMLAAIVLGGTRSQRLADEPANRG